MTSLLLCNLGKNIVKKLIWKLIDIIPNQVLNFLNILTENGKIIADYTNAWKECYYGATILSC